MTYYYHEANRLPGDEVDRLERLARLLDDMFEVPGLGLRFGLDPIIGLLPGLGDTITTIVSLHILIAAARLGVPKTMLVRMAANVAFDFLAGAVPVVGDVIDVAWKANVKNVGLLKEHVAGPAYGRGRRPWGDWLLLGALALGLIGLLALSVTVAWLIATGIWRSLRGG